MSFKLFSSSETAARVFAGVFGGFLGLALLKFGNPPIMEKYVTAPNDVWEFVLVTPWPILWGYALLVLVALVGLVAARWQSSAPVWLLSLPLLWLTWQALATLRSIVPELSHLTLAHFAACVVCFYLGLGSLRHGRVAGWFWGPLVCAFLIVLAIGCQQHFGGLAETRRYFFLYIYPHSKNVPPELLKRLLRDRIFSTLFYPNALAGGVLLLLPPILASIWNWHEWFTPGARQFLMGAVATAALACLYWSGSKGGWLLMLLLGLLALLRTPWPRRIKTAVIAVVVVVGLIGFILKYAGFFERGATSVSARFDYWSVAVRIAGQHPLFGTGPGTFGSPYQRLKRSGSESTRLVHNDYLEQASDSGFPGAAAYALFMAGALAWSFRFHTVLKPLPVSAVSPRSTGGPAAARGLAVHGNKLRPSPPSKDWLRFSVWLGVLGWCLQGLFEFSLYIPALSWLAFALLGWLLRTEG